MVSQPPEQPNHRERMERLEEADLAGVLLDRTRLLKSVQASVDAHNERFLGVKPPEDDMINTGNINIYPEQTQRPQSPRKGLSALAAMGLGLLTAAVPAAGVIGYLLNNKPAIEKVLHIPGSSYDVDVDMEVIPPAK